MKPNSMQGTAHPFFVQILRLLLIAGFLIFLPSPLQTKAAPEKAVRPAPQLNGPDLPYQAVSAGDYFSCVLRRDGQIVCQGDNSYGQTNPALNAFYVQVSSGGYHACGLHYWGEITCWGLNGSGQTTVPEGVYTQVSAGEYHTCGLKEDGSVVCWGFNPDNLSAPDATFTQISAGDDFNCGLTNSGNILCWGNIPAVPAPPPGINYAQVSSGRTHACGLKTDGSITCWGNNEDGQLNVPEGNYTQITTGKYDTCGLKNDGSLTCWGATGHDLGQTTVPSLSGGETFIQVSAGIYHTCGMKSKGGLICWGANGANQTAIPDITYTYLNSGAHHACGLISNGTVLCWGASQVLNVPEGPFTQLAGGTAYVCGLRNEGNIVCWGSDLHGETIVPEPPNGLTYTQISAGYHHTCGLRSDGNLICWGDNTYGQTNVTALPAGEYYTQVSASPQHTCGLKNNGSILCWGYDYFGETIPPILPNGEYFTQISTGSAHTCGLKNDGNLICWGNSYNGETNVPSLPASTIYTQVSASSTHSCALRNDGEIVCWGSDLLNYGVNVVPALPSGIIYTQTSVGLWHSCGLRSDGVIVCWGSSEVTSVLYYGTDFTAPTTNSILRTTSSPTNSASVTFKVIFNEYVTGVNSADFELAMDGLISDASIESVTGSGNSYFVTVNTGNGNGSLGLNVIDDDSIRDAVNLPLGGTGTGNGNFLGEEVYIITKTAPGAFTKISPAQGAGGQSVDPLLTWGTSSDVERYEYCIDTTNDNTCSNWVTNGTSTSKTPSGLIPNTTYYWHVRAFNILDTIYSDGSGAAFRSFRTSALPGAFNKTAPANNAIRQSTNPKLTWGASAGATGYEYCYDTTNNNTCDSGWNSAGTTSGTLSGLNNNTIYYWQARAVNPGGPRYANTGVWWNFKVAISPPNSLAPGAIVPNLYEQMLTRRPIFTWENVAGATSYTVEVSTSATFGTKAINATASSNSYTHPTDLAANTVYYWRVKANATNGPSLYSQVRTFRTANPPSTPTLASPANNALVTTNTPLLDWNNSIIPAGAPGFLLYQVELATDSTFNSVFWGAHLLIGITYSQVEAPPLPGGRTYYWRVRAANVGLDGIEETADDEYSGWSWRSVRIAYDAPANLSPANLANNIPLRPTFSWDAIPGASSYTLQVSKNAAFTQLAINKSVYTNSYTHTMNLLRNFTYYWRVRANGAYGPSLWSAPIFQFLTIP